MILAVTATPALVHAQAAERHPTVLAPAAIDWPAVSAKINADRTEKASQLLGFLTQRRAFDATTLPIILPAAGSGVSLRKMTFSSFGDAYGMALPQEQMSADLTIVITATRSFVAADKGTLNPAEFETVTIAGQPVQALFADTESGQTASFPLYGALYSIDIDCGQQGEGSPCADADLIRRVVASFSNVTVGRAGQAELDALRPSPPDTSERDRWRRVEADPADLGPEDRESYERRWPEQRRDHGDGEDLGDDAKEPPTPDKDAPRDTKPDVPDVVPPTPEVIEPVKPDAVSPVRPDVPVQPEAPRTVPETAVRKKSASNPFFDWLLGQIKPAPRVESVTQ